jgi:glycosyltransferase involved in cell wall biosynthesis
VIATAESIATAPATAYGVRPLRALFVHSGNIFGGVETLLVALARHRGHAPAFQPEFALAFAGRLRDELVTTGAAVHDIGPVRFRRPDRILRARRQVADLLRTADVCVTQSGWSHALFAPVARRAGVPVVLWTHGIGNPRHWLERLAARTMPDVFLANSRFTADALTRRFAACRVEVCYGPMDLPDLEALRSRRPAIRAAIGTPQDAVVVAQAGRFEPQKGYLEHLEALQFVKGTGRWETWIIGDARTANERRFKARLMEAVAAQRLDNVRFLGERVDVPTVLAAADIYCQPNTWPEAFGLTFTEALAAGLPVITAPVGGALEIVDDSCGRFVEPGELRALARELTSLIDDSVGRDAMGRAGVARARQLVDPARQVPALEAILRSVARLQSPS